jgi:TPR repeat protein
VRLYRAAAEGGDRPAQLALATLYESGRGVAKDPVAACAWYAIAAADPLRLGDRPDAARRRDAIAARLDPTDRALALEAARRWAPRKD